MWLFKNNLKVVNTEISESIKYYKKSLSMIHDLKGNSACPNINSHWFDPESQQLEILIKSFKKILEIIKASKHEENQHSSYIFLFAHLKKEYHLGELKIFDPTRIFLHLTEEFQTLARDFLKYRTVLSKEIAKLNQFKVQFNSETLLLKADSKLMIEEFISIIKKINAAALVYHADLLEIKKIEDSFDSEFKIVKADIKKIEKTAQRMFDLRKHYKLPESGHSLDFDLGNDVHAGMTYRFSHEKEHNKMVKRILKYETIIAKRLNHVLEKFNNDQFKLYPKDTFEYHTLHNLLRYNGTLENFSKELPIYLSEFSNFCAAITKNYENYRNGNEGSYSNKKFSNNREIVMVLNGKYGTNKTAYCGVIPAKGNWYASGISNSLSPKEYVHKLKTIVKEGYKPSDRSNTDFYVKSLFVKIKVPLRNIFYMTKMHSGYGPAKFTFSLRKHYDFCGHEGGEHYLVTDKNIPFKDMKLLINAYEDIEGNYRKEWYDEFISELNKEKIKYEVRRV